MWPCHFKCISTFEIIFIERIVESYNVWRMMYCVWLKNLVFCFMILLLPPLVFQSVIIIIIGIIFYGPFYSQSDTHFRLSFLTMSSLFGRAFSWDGWRATCATNSLHALNTQAKWKTRWIVLIIVIIIITIIFAWTVRCLTLEPIAAIAVGWANTHFIRNNNRTTYK